MRAGLARRITPIGFLATKAVGAFVGAVGGALLGAAGSGGVGTLLIAVGGGLVGYLLPDTFLTMKTGRAATGSAPTCRTRSTCSP